MNPVPDGGLDLESRLLYRDSDILILNKPPGFAVHEAPGAGMTLEPDLDSLRFGLKWRPALAHRLDRDTGGCLVLGRHPQAVRALMALFAEAKVEKTYWAVVRDPPDGEEGRIEKKLLKVHRGRRWFMTVDSQGQSAATEWRCLGRGLLAEAEAIGWLQVKPLTGRMHQIRVHCAALGCPVLGDSQYGRNAESPGIRLHLHARAVRFTYGKKTIEALSEPPLMMHPALAVCGWRAAGDSSN